MRSHPDALVLAHLRFTFAPVKVPARPASTLAVPGPVPAPEPSIVDTTSIHICENKMWLVLLSACGCRAASRGHAFQNQRRLPLHILDGGCLESADGIPRVRTQSAVFAVSPPTRWLNVVSSSWHACTTAVYFASCLFKRHVCLCFLLVEHCFGKPVVAVAKWTNGAIWLESEAPGRSHR